MLFFLIYNWFIGLSLFVSFSNTAEHLNLSVRLSLQTVFSFTQQNSTLYLLVKKLDKQLIKT